MTSQKNSILFLVDKSSFPQHCGELDDFLDLVEPHYSVEFFDTDNPTLFFNKALSIFQEDERVELVVPVTRNFYVRDKLRMEGVGLVVSI